MTVCVIEVKLFYGILLTSEQTSSLKRSSSRVAVKRKTDTRSRNPPLLLVSGAVARGTELLEIELSNYGGVGKDVDV